MTNSFKSAPAMNMPGLAERITRPASAFALVELVEMLFERFEHVPRRTFALDCGSSSVSTRCRFPETTAKAWWWPPCASGYRRSASEGSPDDRPDVFRYKTASGKRTLKNMFSMRPMVAAAAAVGSGARCHRVVARCMACATKHQSKKLIDRLPAANGTSPRKGRTYHRFRRRPTEEFRGHCLARRHDRCRC